jgi:hypothetical protein
MKWEHGQGGLPGGDDVWTNKWAPPRSPHGVTTQETTMLTFIAFTTPSLIRDGSMIMNGR